MKKQILIVLFISIPLICLIVTFRVYFNFNTPPSWQTGAFVFIFSVFAFKNFKVKDNGKFVLFATFALLATTVFVLEIFLYVNEILSISSALTTGALF